MAAPKVSMKGLAKFITATATGQRKVVKDFKYPDPEGRVQALYYKPVFDVIRRYHDRGNDLSILVAGEVRYSLRAASERIQRKADRYRNQAVLIRSYYSTGLSSRAFEIKERFRHALRISGVTVSVAPELYANETIYRAKRVRVVKFECSAREPSEDVYKILAQTMLMAFEDAGINLPASAFEVVDIRRGNVIRGARVRSRLRNEIENACANYYAIWDTI